MSLGNSVSTLIHRDNAEKFDSGQACLSYETESTLFLQNSLSTSQQRVRFICTTTQVHTVLQKLS